MTGFILLFYIVFLAFIIVPFIRNSQISDSGTINTEYTSRLTSACHSAMQEAQKGLGTAITEDVSGIWNSESNRRSTADAFYQAAYINFSQQNYTDEAIDVAIPIMMLIDNDGYYLYYNALFNSEEVLNPGDTDYLNHFNSVNQMSSIMTWAEDKFGYTVRYYLNDYVSVTTPNGIIYEDDRKEVAKKMVEYESGVTDSSDIIKYLRGESIPTGEDYERDKMDAITDLTQDTLNYYINERNYASGRNGDGYVVTMPKMSKEDWHRLFKNPTVLAFIQGKNTNTGKVVINTFAYAGSEIIVSDKYFITEEGADHHKIYHSLNEELNMGRVSIIDDRFYYNGDLITALYPSMADCAVHNATPCLDCIK